MPRYALAAAHATSVPSPSLGCEGPPARTSLGCGQVGKVRVEDKAHVGTLPPQGLPLRTSQELRTAAPTLSQYGWWKHSDQEGLVGAQPGLLGAGARWPLTDPLVGEPGKVGELVRAARVLA